MEQDYRDLFAYGSQHIYFNHASTGLLPKQSATAMKSHIDKIVYHGELPIEEILSTQATFRQQASRLLNVNPDEIVFVKNTTDGLGIALHSIDWQPGDNMIVQEDAFPASLYLAHYCFPGIEKRYLPLGDGKQFYDRLKRLIDERTKAVVVDYVHFLSGYRMDLHRLRDMTSNTNAYLIVDGIQGLGAVKIDLTETPVDFFTAGGIKWLSGPSGSGIFYVRKEIIDELVPFHITWFGSEYEDLSSLYPIRPLKEDASRYQPANENFIGMTGLMTSIQIFNEIGPRHVEGMILKLTDQLMHALRAYGCEILTPESHSQRAGIVTFRHPNIETAKLYETLSQNGVTCSLREGWVRFAIHFYNTESEIQEALAIVESAIK